MALVISILIVGGWPFFIAMGRRSGVRQVLTPYASLIFLGPVWRRR